MASNLPGDCCTAGFLHTGTPKGKVEQLGPVPVYISQPPAPSRKVIFVISDVVGIGPANGRLVTDAFAAAGYIAVMPDLLNNDAVVFPRPADNPWNAQEWLSRHGPAETEPNVQAVLAAVHETYHPTSVGAVGYCFGGKFAIRLLGVATELGARGVDAAFVAHPSFVDMSELAAIKKPLSIAAAETDWIFTTELRHASEKKMVEIGATYQINLYSGVSHGFANRGDPDKKMDRFAKEGATKQAIAWFDEFLQ